MNVFSAKIFSAGVRGATALLSPAGVRARLSILIYHRVLPCSDLLRADEIDTVSFERQIAALADHFHVMRLDEAAARLRQGTLPARAACISFDDGYADNVTIALPILQRLRLPATFFIATGYLDGGRMWNDTVIEAVRRIPGPWLDLQRGGLGRHPIRSDIERHCAARHMISMLKYMARQQRDEHIEELVRAASAPLPEDLMMRRDQVRALYQAGMTIGAHTVSHPILTKLDLRSARAEIAQGREVLEEIIGDRVTLFAYPNGKPGQDYTDEHVRVVREMGFAAAVSTAAGAAYGRSDIHQLPRFTPWDRTHARFVLRMLWNFGQRSALA